MNTCSNHNQCISSALKQAENICLERKILFTQLRRTVFKLIWQSHIPLKAYDILQQLQKKDPAAKPITVYRALDFLLKNNMVHKLESQNTYFGCTHPGELHNCYFLVCKKCQVVEEGCRSDLLQNIYANLRKNDFVVEHVTLEIQGLCKNCT